MVQKSLFLAISGMAGNGGGVGLPQEVARENWFCQNRPYCGRTKPRVRKQNVERKQIRQQKEKNKLKLTKDSSFTITSRLGGIGRVGSPAPMFIELGTSLVKAMLWWG